MGTAVLAARLVLAAVFTAASVGKLRDLPGSRRAVAEFGVGESIAGPVGTVLPLTELAVALALLARPTATWGAIGALVLLLAFIAGIASAIARGEAPDCHCFGTIHSAPAGRGQIVRNVALAAVAGFIVGAGPGPTINNWVSARGASQVVAVVLGFVLLALLATSLVQWRENRHLRTELAGARRIVARTPPGLPIGSLAPNFAVRDTEGNTVSLDGLRSRGQPIVLVFGVAGCGPCSVLVPELPRWQEALAGDLTVGVVGIGTYLRYEAAAERLNLSLQEVYERDPDLAREADELNAILGAYRLKATPSAVVVTSEGTIASATVDGRPAIEALIRLAATRRGAAGIAAREAVVA